MHLTNPMKMLQFASENGFAIPSFNIHNLETIQAVCEGAMAENSPVMIQTTPGTINYAGLPYVTAIIKRAAEINNIPMALHLDHCPSYEMVVQCVINGYTSIMIDGAELPFEENVALVKKTVEMAHAAGVAAEGELGRLGGVEDDLEVSEADAAFTVPEEAVEFVEKTGIDFLAIAIGTAHGLYKGIPKLDFKRLSEIRKRVSIPLVLHGASGLADEQVTEAVQRGISKINIATELKIPFADTIRKRLNDNPKDTDPRSYLAAARESVVNVVRHKIKICQSNGRADDLR